MNIVIIRPGAIGDTLLTFPLLRALRTRYPNPYITFVGNIAVLPLALEAGLVDAISDYQALQWSELFSDAGIQAPKLGGLLSGADLVIGWLRDADHVVERNLREAGARQAIIAPGRPPEGERIHIMDYLARTIGMEGVPRTFYLDRSRIDGVHHIERRAIIAIHPGSGSSRKCWPVEQFAGVIERLWQQRQEVLVVGGPADGKRLAYLRQRLLPPAPGLLVTLEDAPLIEVARQLQQCRCYLGNDSGITHLAAMLGLPIVALFGPSDPLVWHPVGPDDRLIRVLFEPDLAHLPVDVVMDEILHCP
jgi:heptosyltransferase-3